jgi:hypothetical protein
MVSLIPSFITYLFRRCFTASILCQQEKMTNLWRPVAYEFRQNNKPSGESTVIRPKLVDATLLTIVTFKNHWVRRALGWSEHSPVIGTVAISLYRRTDVQVRWGKKHLSSQLMDFRLSAKPNLFDNII